LLPLIRGNLYISIDEKLPMQAPKEANKRRLITMLKEIYFFEILKQKINSMIAGNA
jgi:hypothetical protein|tara:strand:+ start:2660 stop:2827 length:168 start_codon:yes stop_codon:yes gene_type:complete